MKNNWWLDVQATDTQIYIVYAFKSHIHTNIASTVYTWLNSNISSTCISSKNQGILVPKANNKKIGVDAASKPTRFWIFAKHTRISGRSYHPWMSWTSWMGSKFNMFLTVLTFTSTSSTTFAVAFNLQSAFGHQFIDFSLTCWTLFRV